MTVGQSASRTGAPPGEQRFGGAMSSIWQRLASRRQVDDAGALVVEECLGPFECGRALFAGIDEATGTLVARFGFGMDPVPALGHALGEVERPIVAALLDGFVRPIDADELRACGVEDASPPGHAVLVPLPALPLVGSDEGALAAACPLHRLSDRRAPGTPCWLDRVSHEDPAVPEWAVRVRTLCPRCPVLGTVGIVLAERSRPFSPAELDRLALVGRLAGQHARANEAVARQDRGQAKLRQERQWLDTVMVAAADPIVVTDTTNALVLQNRRAEELLVSTPEDSEGRRRALAINDIGFSAYLSSLAIDPKRAPRELSLVDPVYGNDLLFEAISVPARGATGQRLGVVTVLRDVTDLQRATVELHELVYKAQKAETAMRHERDRLTRIVQSAVDPIVVTNPSNDIVLANAYGERLFQTGPGDPPQKQRLIVSNDTVLSSFLTELLADPAQQRRRELKLTDPVAVEVRAFDVTAAKVRDERGETVVIVTVLHDVTELKELERRRVEQKLFESEKLAATGRLAASIAHEVNNPLESIKNSLYILKSRVSGDETVSRFIEVARKECERVSGIMKQFLGFYRPSAARVPVDVAAIIDYELRLVASQMEKRDIRAERQLEPTPPVHANEDQLKQVFLNLILNAVEAMAGMPGGGTLTVATRHRTRPSFLSPTAPFVCITIAHTGPGISPEHMPSLFEPFFTTKQEKGTGLGLWVSYGLVKAHGGDIKVETEPGRGTKFHVILPVGAAPVGAAPANAAPVGAAPVGAAPANAAPVSAAPGGAGSAGGAAPVAAAPGGSP